jgi:outer membrane receptor protein involved in Fe transport
VSGLTLDDRYRYDLRSGFVELFASALVILSDQTQSIAWVPRVDVVGTVGEPPKWKAVAGADWRSTSIGAELRINSISGGRNILANPYQSVSSFTTVDAAVHYDWPNEESFLLRNVTLGLAVQNIADRHPPLVQIPEEEATIGRPTIPFDGTNASTVGRLIELSLIKRW